MKEDVRRRLQRFYEFYNPSCLSSVDTILSTYSGREEDIFRVLVDKYGPEPSSELSTSRQIKGMSDWASRFYNFYAYYCPDKLKDLPQKIEKHAGREAEWMSLLVMKYGEEPPGLDKEGEKMDARDVGKHFVMTIADTTSQELSTCSMKKFKNDDHYDEDGNAKNARELPGNDVDHVLKRLSEALDVKTAEALKLKCEKEHLAKCLSTSEEMVIKLQEKQKDLRRQMALSEELLKEKLRLLDKFESRESCERAQESTLHEELLASRRDCSMATTSLARQERRNRILEAEKEQLLSEVKEAERRAMDANDLLSAECRKNMLLLEELGRLKLHVERPGNEAAFASLIHDIEKRLAEHYESEKNYYRKEMADYYKYAEDQLRRRDKLIADLSTSFGLPST